MTMRNDPSPDRTERGSRRTTAASVASLVSVVGLLVLALCSVYLFVFFGGSASSSTPTVTQQPGSSDEPVVTDRPRVTPNPSVVITPPPDLRPTVTGTLLFTRTGNIWAASGLNLTQISNKGTDSSPDWSPDGSTIYFVQTIDKQDQTAPFPGPKYDLPVTSIGSMNADGSGRNIIFQGLFHVGGGVWFTGVYQPDVSPDGKTFALVSDFGYVPVTGCDSCYQPVELATMTTSGTKLTNLHVPTANDLGHNDPEWSPNGKQIAFTYNAKSGAIGAPKIGIYTVSTGHLMTLKRGYANPSWAPDGSAIAAERTDGNGRDVVILDPNKGTELARLTTDGNSFAPVFSPDGNQIAYLHRQGLGVDLWVMTLDFTSGGVTLTDNKPITQDGSLDASSPPAWFIPADQRTTPPSFQSAPATPPPASPSDSSVP
jgi:Tol biopolymer transport system component